MFQNTVNGKSLLIFCEKQKFSRLVRWSLTLDSVIFIIFILPLLSYPWKEHTQPLPWVVMVVILTVLIASWLIFPRKQSKQEFSRLVRWLLIPDFMVSIIIFIELLPPYPWKEHTQPLPWVVMVAILTVPSTIITFLFWMSKLETEVCSDGLYIRFFPFHINFKRFAFEDISEYYAREYRPVLVYDGWGIRYSCKIYNISSKKGLQIILKNGKRLLVGSQKPQELAVAIDSIIKSNAG